MNSHIQALSNDAGTLAKDAGALMAATANRAQAQVLAARKRVGIALDGVRMKTAAGVRTANQTVHEHPYEGIGVALAVGALIGFLIARRFSRPCD